MRVRRIAVLIDAAFFLKRLPKLVEAQFRTTPQQVVESARHMCMRHVLRLTHAEAAEDAEGRWLDHEYRLFYYDAEPFDGVAHHPILNRKIDFGKSDVATFRKELFAELRRKRKFALRLGHVARDTDWSLSPRLTRHMLKIGRWLERLESTIQQRGVALPLSDGILRELRDVLAAWQAVSEELTEHVDEVVSVFPRPARDAEALIAA